VTCFVALVLAPIAAFAMGVGAFRWLRRRRLRKLYGSM
jgi:hypothetical protein|tara:strand:+ start:468 stop:581 length:114 start_codon:yes stop_codon:yes gene_type:complete